VIENISLPTSLNVTNKNMSHKRKKRHRALSTKRRTKKNIMAANKSLNIDKALRSALQYHQDGQLDRAKAICDKILTLSPNHAGTLHLLGLIACQVGKIDVAIDLIDKAIQASPQNAAYYNSMGNVLTHQGKKDDAIACYRNALGINPNLVEAHYNMGNVFQDQGKLNEAITCYKNAIQIAPNIAQPHNNMGNALKDQGKLDEAVACYRQALEINPNLAEAHYNMANVFEDQGKLDEAIGFYRKALEIKPDYVEAHCGIGNVFEDQGKLHEAIGFYRKALEIAPNHARAYCSMGNALKYQGKLAEAAACFEKAVELDPENSSAKHHLAAVTGRTTEAPPQEYIRKVFDHYSPKFERHVVETLHYKIPSLLRQNFHTIVKNDLHFKNVIDLGCGTGLAGIEFRLNADRLSGIDISPKIVEEAKKKHVYDILRVADIIEFLNDTDEKYDLFIATDVFVYSGNLKGIFESVQNCSLSGAYFLFSTENCAGNEYILRPTGRYAHSRTYIQSLAKEYGFVIEMCQAAGVRKEHGQWIMGDIFILKSGA
jgi:predicted TPR repeat methyltransferase